MPRWWRPTRVASAVESRTPDGDGGDARRAFPAGAAGDVRAVLGDPDALGAHVQPLVELCSGQIVGYEALARITAPVAPLDTGAWFALARRCGLGPALEAAALRAALALPPTPDGAFLAINVSVSALEDPGVWAALPDELSGVMLEITEHELVRDYTGLMPRLAALRDRGARIAVDDAGAGYAGLRHMIELAPDVLKLDRSLIADIDRDLARQAMVEAFVRYARRVGTTICAEGIETEEELATATALDVAVGQGYLLARPAPPWPEANRDATRVCGRIIADLLEKPLPTISSPEPLRVNDVVAQIAGAGTTAALTGALERVSAALGADRLAVSRLARDGALVPWIGSPLLLTTPDAHLRRGAARQIVRAGATAPTGEAGRLRAAGYGAALIAPVTARGRLRGAVEAYAREPRPWRPTDITHCRLLGDLLGPALAVAEEETPTRRS